MVNERIIWWRRLKALCHPNKPAIPFFTSAADIKKEHDRILNANKVPSKAEPKPKRKYEKSRNQLMKEAGLFFARS
jgi:hypothetical protein